MACFSSKSGCVIWVASNKMHCQLQSEKTKVMLYYVPVNIAAKEVLPACRTRQTALVLKVAVSYGWQSI